MRVFWRPQAPKSPSVELHTALGNGLRLEALARVAQHLQDVAPGIVRGRVRACKRPPPVVSRRQL
eukprot:5383792-Lingulodinium_polyedra.AAC.1